MERFENKLESLLLHKPYSNLTATEQAYVLQFLTEEEYSKCHSFLNATEKVFDSGTSDIKPHPTVQKNLKKAFIAAYKTPLFTFDGSSLRFPQVSRIPAFLACVGMLCLAYFLYPHPYEKQQEAVQIKPVEKHQTIELTRVENKLFIKKNATAKASKIIKKVALYPSTHTKNPGYKGDGLVSDNIDTPCLTTSIEPLGIDLYPEELSTPGLNIDGRPY